MDAHRTPDDPGSQMLIEDEDFFREVIQSIFATDDANGDGLITLKEYIAAHEEYEASKDEL